MKLCKCLSFLSLIILAVVVCAYADSQTTMAPTAPTTAAKITTTSQPTNETTPHGFDCSAFSQSCKICLDASDDCFYCGSAKECRPLPTNLPFGLPFDAGCSLDSVMYKTCDISLLLLAVIITSVGGAFILAAIFIAICCCIRCHKRPRVQMENIEVTWSNNPEADERKEQRETRNEDRESRYDQIRMKYGLSLKSDGSKYSKLDNED